jgi:glycosyltransferase involved in cell wall biosynthesis
MPTPEPFNVAILTDSFPELSETFIAGEANALRAAGHRVRVEARAHAVRPSANAQEDFPVSWQDDDSQARRLVELGRQAFRAPLRVGRDLRERPSWAAGEVWIPSLRRLAPPARRLLAASVQHLHAHFASGGAFDALRLARLLDISWSVTAHAYEIYTLPQNLERKLAAADFVTSGCEYTVRDLRRLMPPGREEDVHEIVMGVDLGRFRRREPHPADRIVVAVARFVEKKGLQYLLDALALLEPAGTVERLVLVGAGPLEGRLREQTERLAVAHRVEWAGALEHDGVRDVLERADLLAMPSVVAADGDRDSMPVVVKEALAMEVPVVCSDEVGLPELVRAEWGRLVPPGDAAALAEGIRELLDLFPDQRAAMGRAGRTFVSDFADVNREAAKLAELIERSVRAKRASRSRV